MLLRRRLKAGGVRASARNVRRAAPQRPKGGAASSASVYPISPTTLPNFRSPQMPQQSHARLSHNTERDISHRGALPAVERIMTRSTRDY